VLAARRNADPGAEDLAGWSIHDLRRTVATDMARLGIASFIISRVFNHVVAGVTAKHYNHYDYLTEKRYALDTWAAYLSRLVEPAAEKRL
jgi:integrase